MIAIRRLIILAIVLTLLFTPYLATAQELNIPDDRKALEEAYRDMFDIAKEYKKLYEEEHSDLVEIQQERDNYKEQADKWKELYENSEADVERLLESVNSWKDLYHSEREMVMELMNKKDMSVSTGIGYNFKNPDESLALLQFEFGF